MEGNGSPPKNKSRPFSHLGLVSEHIAAVQRDLAGRNDRRAGALQQVGDGRRVDERQLGHVLQRARGRERTNTRVKSARVFP